MEFVDVIYCDNQKSISRVKPTDDTHHSLTIDSQTFNCVFYSARIVFMSSHNLPVQHGMFDIQDIKVVFRHLFDGMNS